MPDEPVPRTPHPVRPASPRTPPRTRPRTRPTPRRPRRMLTGAAVGVAGMVGVVALTLAAAADGTAARPAPAGATAPAPAVGSGVAVLRGEIAAMEAAGMPADHPKVELLRHDLATLEAAGTTPAGPAAGVDVAARRGAGTRSAAAEPSGFDDGPVACEPLPGLLTAADVEGARCSSTLQADGSSLYVAERPDGSRRAVRFGPDGPAVVAVETHGTVTPAP